jgi:hypothetical protein
MTTHETDIVLGELYEDADTGLQGVADSIHFYRNACERVVLKYVHDGDLKDASFDAVDLIHVDSGKQAKSRKTGGPQRTMPPRR